jgi:hypothetical protein
MQGGFRRAIILVWRNSTSYEFTLPILITALSGNLAGIL